jgi:hypothetical protein
LESPPKIPPALFVFVTILPFLMVNKSLFSDPFFSDPKNPDPNSIALTAGMLKTALLISASKDEKIGSPKPTGNPVHMHSITPPNESPSFLVCSIASLI